jgi:hypothetical protein
VNAHYVLAADIGQVADYTALVALRRSDGRNLECIGIDRIPLGTPYPAQANRLAALTRQGVMRGRCLLAVDATGVGKPVVDLLRPAVRPTPFYAITITSGSIANRDGNDWHVPKRDLIGAAQVALQQRRLRIAATLADASVLADELMAYRVTIAANGHDTYGNDWRQAEHDDLVLALAIGSTSPTPPRRGRAGASRACSATRSQPCHGYRCRPMRRRRGASGESGKRGAVR